MSCEAIASNIVSNCSTQKVGGLEVKAWIVPRADLIIDWDETDTNMITGLSVKATKKAYTITGVKQLLKAMSEAVVAEDRDDRWTHKYSLQMFEWNAAAIQNGNALNDVVVFVENKDKSTDGDGDFFCLGAKSGLFKATDTFDSSANSGARLIELAGPAGGETSLKYIVFKTGYAETLAMLTALETIHA